MKKTTVATLALCALATPALPQTAGTRVGIINIQDAIVRTEDGQKVAKMLQEKYAPRQSELEKKKRELDELQAQLSKGRNTMSEEARNNLIRQIDQKTKSLTRDNEDATAEFQQEEAKHINGIGQRMMGVVDKFAKDKGYSIILDISSQQSPVLWAVNTVDITNEIVTLYDKSELAAPAAPAAAPTGAVTKPPVTAPVTRPPGPRAAPKTPAQPRP